MKVFKASLCITNLIFLAVCLSSIGCKKAELPMEVKQAKENHEKDPNNYGLHLKYAKDLFLITEKIPDFNKQAYEELGKVYEKNKNNAEAMVYYGAATTKMANYAKSVEGKMDYVKKGFELLDEAVQIAPDNIEVRMARGLTGIAVPDFLKRYDNAIKDFEYIINSAEKKKQVVSEKTLSLARESLKKGLEIKKNDK